MYTMKKKACKIAKKYFSLKLENKTLLKSKFFNFSKNTFQKMDIIIFDDVLSWIDRDVILPTFGVTLNITTEDLSIIS